jgi:hypothetical protein
MEEQFSYLKVNIDEGDEKNHIHIRFSLYDDVDFHLIDQYDFHVSKCHEYNADYEIGFYYEKINITSRIARSIQRMVYSRIEGEESSTDRIGYFGMLVSALNQFVY